MQHDHGRALRIAALFDMEMVTIANIQHTLVEGFDRRKKVIACALLARELVHTPPI